MSKLILSTLVLLIFVFGCSNQENSISEPVYDNLSKELVLTDSLPNPIVSVSQLINGAEGGWINLSKSYIDPLGRSMSVEASIFFPQGSFSGAQTITVSANFSDASIEFYPAMQFNKWLALNVWYQNLPLCEMGYSSNDKVNFVYFDDEGNVQPISNKSVSMNFNQGSLKVNNAWLNHFSRYGFIRKEEQPIQCEPVLSSE